MLLLVTVTCIKDIWMTRASVQGKSRDIDFMFMEVETWQPGALQSKTMATWEHVNNSIFVLLTL